MMSKKDADKQIVCKTSKRGSKINGQERTFWMDRIELLDGQERTF
jgi:hypothetical protein